MVCSVSMQRMHNFQKKCIIHTRTTVMLVVVDSILCNILYNFFLLCFVRCKYKHNVLTWKDICTWYTQHVILHIR